jgi:hypothetical protein
MTKEIVRRTTNALSRPRQEKFLQALEEKRMNVSAACRKAGIATSTAYHQRRMDESFAAEWQVIEDNLLDHLEEHEWKEAETDGKSRRWIMTRLRPDRWGDHKTTKVEGTVKHVHSVKELDDDQLKEIVRRGIQEGAIDAEYAELVDE